jgi:hypothetical protein
VQRRRRSGEAFVLGEEQVFDQQEPDLGEAPSEPVKPLGEFAGTWAQALELPMTTLLDSPGGADDAKGMARTREVNEEAGVADATRGPRRGRASGNIGNGGDGGKRDVPVPTTERAGGKELCDGQRSEQVEEGAPNRSILGAGVAEEGGGGGAPALHRASSTSPIARLLRQSALPSVLSASAIALASVLALHDAGGGPRSAPLKAGSEPRHPDASGDSPRPHRDPRRREHGADQVVSAPLTASAPSPSPAGPPPADSTRVTSPRTASAPAAVPSAASSPLTAQARRGSSSAEAADRRTLGREFGQP